MKTFRFGHYSSRRQKALDWIDKIDKKEGKVRERIKEEAP